MFWICDANSVDSTGTCSVIAEQCFHRVKGFSTSNSLPASRLGAHEKLGGDDPR